MFELADLMGIFIDEEFNQTSDLLQQLIDKSDRMPLILGESGTGKTTLLKHLSNLAADEWELCLVEATPMLQPHQLLAHLGRCFRVSGHIPDLDEIVRTFEDLKKRGRLPVILVDDAHQLPVTSIISLLRLGSRHPNGQPLVKIVLFALPQIDLLLKMPLIQAMNLHNIKELELSPMSKERVERFIQFILHQMDLEGKFEISQEQLNWIYQASGGKQGRVLAELRQLLNPGSGEDLQKREVHSRLGDLSTPVVFGGVLIAALILTLVLFQDEINSLFAEKKLIETPQTEMMEMEIETVSPVHSLTATSSPESQPIPTEETESIPEQSLSQVPALEFIPTEEEKTQSPIETQRITQTPIISESPAVQLPEMNESETTQGLPGDQTLSNEIEALPETRTMGENSTAITEAVSALKKGEPLMQHETALTSSHPDASMLQNQTQLTPPESVPNSTPPSPVGDVVSSAPSLAEAETTYSSKVPATGIEDEPVSLTVVQAPVDPGLAQEAPEISEPEPPASTLEPANTVSPTVETIPETVGSQVEPPAEATAVGGSVTRAIIASGVADHEPIDDLGAYVTLKNNGYQKIFFFTEMRNFSDGKVIHRWEHKDRILADVPLWVARSWSWRTYSSKDLLPHMTGDWTVSVIDARGQILASRTFTFDR